MQLFGRRDFQYLYDAGFSLHDRGDSGVARFLLITDEGVFYDASLLEGGAALKILRWKPVHELTGPNKPPSAGPALPFKFTAGQLAAFMLSGWGGYFQEVFGSLDTGPNAFVLREEHEDASDAYEALRQAYGLYLEALHVVGKLDGDLQQRAHDLAARYGDELDQALKREKVMEDGISRAEYRLRRRKAKAPLASLKLEAAEARSRAEVAFKTWRRSLVRQLLQPPTIEDVAGLSATGVGSAGASGIAARGRVSAFEANSQKILDELKRCEIDPQNLPKTKNGHPGVRSRIRDALEGKRSGFVEGSRAFKHTWDRMRREGTLK